MNTLCFNPDTSNASLSTTIWRVSCSDGTQYFYRGIWIPQEGEWWLDGGTLRQATGHYPTEYKAVFFRVEQGITNK